MTTLWLDLETYSEVELKTAGVYVYAAHPSTEITLCVALVDPTVTLISHNANFDRIVMENCLEIPD